MVKCSKDLEYQAMIYNVVCTMAKILYSNVMLYAIDEFQSIIHIYNPYSVVKLVHLMN
jgi:hypothetical protein